MHFEIENQLFDVDLPIVFVCEEVDDKPAAFWGNSVIADQSSRDLKVGIFLVMRAALDGRVIDRHLFLLWVIGRKSKCLFPLRFCFEENIPLG